jgi:hypothetical protein
VPPLLSHFSAKFSVAKFSVTSFWVTKSPGSTAQAKRFATGNAHPSCRHETPRPLTTIPVVVLARLIVGSNESQLRPSPRIFRGVEHPRHARDHSTLLRALSMKRRGLNSGDPVCRPIRLSLSSYVPGLRCQPLKSNAPGVQGNAAARISGSIPCAQASRFRPTFQVLFCWGPMPSAHDLLTTAHDFLATRARCMPLRSGRGGCGARPAAAKSAATACAWPAPNSTITAPPGASSAGAVAAICR